MARPGFLPTVAESPGSLPLEATILPTPLGFLDAGMEDSQPITSMSDLKMDPVVDTASGEPQE